MKIAFIVGPFPKLSETFILNQITGLLDMGHEVEIFAQFNPEEKKVHADMEKYRLMERTHYIRMPDNKIKRILKAIYLIFTNFHRSPIKILKSLNIFKYGKRALSLKLLCWLIPFSGKKFDIIHCHFGPTGIIVVQLKDIGVIKGKIITTFYGYDISSFIEGNKNPYYNLFKLGDLFIVISDHMQQKLLDLGCSGNKIIKHPIGVDVGKFSFKKRVIHDGEPVEIVTVARFTEKKGLEYSIKAIAKILENTSGIEYRIVGDGPLRGKIQSLIQSHNVQGKVKLLGWASQDKIQKLYDNSHIFVLASVTAKNGDKEGTPTVLMEAQSAGLPVISTYHSGIPEVVLDGKSGFLVPEKDVNALAERMEYLIEHPEVWAEMGRCGREFVEEHYDIKQLNQKLVEIYSNLINNGKNN